MLDTMAYAIADLKFEGQSELILAKGKGREVNGARFFLDVHRYRSSMIRDGEARLILVEETRDKSYRLYYPMINYEGQDRLFGIGLIPDDLVLIREIKERLEEERKEIIYSGDVMKSIGADNNGE